MHKSKIQYFKKQRIVEMINENAHAIDMLILQVRFKLKTHKKGSFSPRCARWSLIRNLVGHSSNNILRAISI